MSFLWSCLSSCEEQFGLFLAGIAPSRVTRACVCADVAFEKFKTMAGEYKTKTEDLRPKNEDPVKIVLKSLKKGSNMILDQSRNKEHQDLQLSTNLTRVFVLYITPPKVQNEDPFKIRIRMLYVCTRMLLVCILMYPYVPCVMTFSTQTILGYQQTI